jgi:hypothetical protein
MRTSLPLWRYPTLVIGLATYYAIYGVIAAFVEPFGWFGGGLLERMGVWGHLILILLPAAMGGIGYLISQQDRAITQRYLGLCAVSSGKSRVDAFQDLRERAQHHIIIVGIGMVSLIQYDLPSLKRQAERVPIDFLMIDPGFLDEEPSFADLLEKFMDVPDFKHKVRSSYNRLRQFCEEWNKEPSNRFKMSLKVYRTIPTNSMVIIDPEQDTGEVIIEFFLYQSGAYRPRFNIVRTNRGDGLFDRIRTEYLKLWENARRVV